MATVWIPALLRTFTDQHESVDVPGANLRDIIEALDAQYPGIKARLCEGDRVRPGLAVVIDTQVVRGGLDERVNDNSEVHFIPAIAGGCHRHQSVLTAPRHGPTTVT